ncbi:MAG: UDP-N-acetylmuramoyl-L-alanyl-D-glutamate--2,6-diaminopimelate ligase, partial [Clostridiales bacterium]|nr:UDP-N-acetylmuramoyl-L-alanyl-D-glutamate--2,6-diaminopimelate ligase [Candidatus Apopatousia equi]
MKLIKLLENIDIIEKVNFDDEIEIGSLCDNSKMATKDCLFFAINGTNTSGENYALEAVKNGAKVIICENFIDELCKSGVCQVKVENIRKAVSKVSANFFENPCDRLKMIAVVGTNGKTSTSHIMYDILTFSSKKVGLIGTNEIIFAGKIIENDMTTPDPIKLQEILFEMAKEKIEYVVMEVSAHAIFLNKVFGIKFEAGIFTNFSQDHLDFFGTMEKYKSVKVGFFDKENIKSAVINIDDEAGKEILRKSNVPVITYGIKNPSDVFAISISMDLGGSEFIVNYFDEVFNIKSNLTCLFNIYNLLSCITLCKRLGIETNLIQKAVENISKIGGRFNLINKGQNFNIIVDYAHTPVALKDLLNNVKMLSKGKIITVFGCPGNRDELKREIMGEIAGENSDYVILTSDNPQYENSYRIMRDIERGVFKTKCPYKLIDDRREAISLAMSLASPKSCVVIVGKGIEKYQNINGEHIEYNDFDEIERIIKQMKKIKLDNKFLI